MVKKIAWSQRAKTDLKEILQYWTSRNKSSVYSRKLKSLIMEELDIVSIHPKIGRITEKEGIRAKVVKDYLLYYEETEDEIRLKAIWDTRQDSDRLQL